MAKKAFKRLPMATLSPCLKSGFFWPDGISMSWFAIVGG
jgi:hypothetical protein